MISTNCIKAYRDVYPKDDCAYAEPSSLVFIVNSEGNTFISPFNETDEEFMKRLEKCQEDGINYFYTEWETLKQEKSVLY